MTKSQNPSLRIPVSIVVQTSGSPSTQLFFSQNLSMTGIYLESEVLLADGELSVGSQTSLLFYLPSQDGLAIAAKAKVVRREQIVSFNGQPTHAIALEFIELDSKDQQRLRHFIADYETALESAVDENEEDTQGDGVEITDPQTVMRPLLAADEITILFEPRTIDDYTTLYDDFLKQPQSVNLNDSRFHWVQSVLQTLDAEGQLYINKLCQETSPAFKDKVLLNIFFLHLKLSNEFIQLQSCLAQAPQQQSTSDYINHYIASISYEVEQSDVVGHVLSQKLVASEDWHSFKLLNNLRQGLQLHLQQFATIHNQIQSDNQKPPIVAASSAAIPRRSVDDCLAELQEMIPDPEEEMDEFANGATGEDIRFLWDHIFGFTDADLKSKLLHALAVRRKVREEYRHCLELGDSIVQHRQEVTAVFRDNAKLIKEAVASLTPFLKASAKAGQAAALVAKLLEGLAFEFGKLVRTIPRLLTNDEVESVRYRSQAFRPKRRQSLAAIQKFTKRYALRVALMITIVITMGYHLQRYWRSQDKILVARLVGPVEIVKAIRDQQRQLYLTTHLEQWLSLSQSRRLEALQALQQFAHDEKAQAWLLSDERGILIAVAGSMVEGSMLETYLTMP